MQYRLERSECRIVRQHINGCLRFDLMAQCVVHALKGLACRAHVAPARLPASHCKQCSALISPSLRMRGYARPFCAW